MWHEKGYVYAGFEVIFAPLNKEKVFYDSAIHFLNSSKDILPVAHSSRLPFAVALQA